MLIISNVDNNCLYFMLMENYSSEWVSPSVLMRNVTYVTYMYE